MMSSTLLLLTIVGIIYYFYMKKPAKTLTVISLESKTETFEKGPQVNPFDNIYAMTTIT